MHSLTNRKAFGNKALSTRKSTRKDEFYSNWRKDIISVVGRYRVVDKIFKARIENGRAFICCNHYIETDFEVTSE